MSPVFFFFLALFGNEPFQKLAGAEVVGIARLSVESMNERRDVLLVAERGFERFPVVREVRHRSGYGGEFHIDSVVLKIAQNLHGMRLLLVGLPLEPVAEAVQASALVESGNGQIEIGGEEFLVDLILKQRFHLCVHDGSPCLERDGNAPLHEKR